MGRVRLIAKSIFGFNPLNRNSNWNKSEYLIISICDLIYFPLAPLTLSLPPLSLLMVLFDS